MKKLIFSLMVIVPCTAMPMAKINRLKKADHPKKQQKRFYCSALDVEHILEPIKDFSIDKKTIYKNYLKLDPELRNRTPRVGDDRPFLFRKLDYDTYLKFNSATSRRVRMSDRIFQLKYYDEMDKLTPQERSSLYYVERARIIEECTKECLAELETQTKDQEKTSNLD